jgi:hypothetical protein
MSVLNQDRGPVFLIFREFYLSPRREKETDTEKYALTMANLKPQTSDLTSQEFSILPQDHMVPIIKILHK